ncbi:MAG TPA: tripartite tricarboxylate transporter substrate-binding protein [Pseudolabrys sp.]|nr:tripartite tricarboxylate transporter substrate-binding protein [Pseudolabrys sp.]
MFRRCFIGGLLTSIFFSLGASSAISQDRKFPSQAIRIIVPFAPGGGVDTLARLIAERIQTKSGASVIVENRAGANATLGGTFVQRAPADGYTVLFSSNTHTMSKLVLTDSPYDPLADFAPIARVGEAPLLVVMSPKMTQSTLAEVGAAVKKNPEQWAAGTPALGSPSHIATIQFMQLTKANLSVVPYRGTAPALNDVAGGHIQLLTDAIVILLPMAKDGKVKGLAVTTKKRSPLAPEIPTSAESGLSGLEVVSWYGMWGPKELPADIINALNAACADAVRELADSGRLTAVGVTPVYETPKEFAAYQAAEVARNAELLKSVGFKPQ